MTEPGTMEYCTFCGCSPESACHIFDHKYRQPAFNQKKTEHNCPICGHHICASVHDDCKAWFTGKKFNEY
jgi:hypothetical protein